MKKVTINLYQFSELSPEAQTYAFREHMEEYTNSIQYRYEYDTFDKFASLCEHEKYEFTINGEHFNFDY